VPEGARLTTDLVCAAYCQRQVFLLVLIHEARIIVCFLIYAAIIIDMLNGTYISTVTSLISTTRADLEAGRINVVAGPVRGCWRIQSGSGQYLGTFSNCGTERSVKSQAKRIVRDVIRRWQRDLQRHLDANQETAA